MPRTRLVPPPTVRLNPADGLLDWVQFDVHRYVSQQMHADFMDAVMQDAMALAAQPASVAMTATAQVERALTLEYLQREVESFRRAFPPIKWVLDNPRTTGHPKSSTKTGDDKMARPEVGTILAYNVDQFGDINAGSNRLFYVMAHDGEDSIRLITLSDTDYDYAGNEYGRITVNLDDGSTWMSINAAEQIKTGFKAYARLFDRENYKPAVGDKVLVTHKPEDIWEGPGWNEYMDSMVGKVFTVQELGTNDRVGVRHDGLQIYLDNRWVQPIALTDSKKRLRRIAQNRLAEKHANWDKHILRRSRRKYHWGKQTGERIAELRAKASRKDATELDVAEYLYCLRNEPRWVGTEVEPALYVGRDKIYNDTWESVGIVPEHRIDALHCLHVSSEDPTKIAYYPTLRHMREGREVRTSLGKYLTKYKELFGFDENKCRDLAQKFAAIQAGQGYTLEFKEQDDPEGWVYVYNHGPHSCMKGEEAVKVYASGVSNLRLAYLEDMDGEIVARCIVRDSDNPSVKGYVRVYPDPNGDKAGRRLLDLLTEKGYGNWTNTTGCLLSYIKNSYGSIICPYIDYGNEGTQEVGHVVVNGTSYLKVGADGVDADNTNGTIEEPNTRECRWCHEYFDEDDLTWVETTDEHVCEDCIDENYVQAYGRYNYTQLMPRDSCTYCESNGEWYDDDHLDRHDIYLCEYNDEYYHLDDLVATDRGFVHQVVEVVILVVEDQDGNMYAHPNDYVTLPDGRKIHDSMAEQDFITGEWLLADEDDDGVVQVFARHRGSSRENPIRSHQWTTLKSLADSIDDWVVEFEPRFHAGKYVQSISCITFKGQETPGSAVISFRNLTYDMIRSDDTFEKIFEYLDEHGLIETLEEAA
jgi:hypothetical protein